ncbi:hypothetical protein ACHQM5_018682 [Ranunculus cassubicifolius]
MNDQSQNMNQLHMMNRSYGGGWSSSIGSLPQPPDDPMMFKATHPRQGFMAAAAKRSGWKGKKGKKPVIGNGSNVINGGIGGGQGGYRPPTLNDLQYQNRMRARKFYGKKNNNRFAPYAPRNTTSFIIRAKKSGGIASLVSPCPVTPAVLPTPIFSPSREVLVDMAKEEWGVDGYGSMNGLIRLRSPGHDMNDVREEDEEEEEGGGSSESDVEEHVEVERRLDHDLSRFEMIYPTDEHGEHQMDDQDAHIAQLEEENLTLKERLFLMEREMIDLKMRMQCLESESRAKKKESESRDGSLENEDGSNKENNNEETTRHSNENDEKHENNDETLGNESVGDKEEEDHDDVEVEASDNEGAGDVCSEKSACDCD